MPGRPVSSCDISSARALVPVQQAHARRRTCLVQQIGDDLSLRAVPLAIAATEAAFIYHRQMFVRSPVGRILSVYL